MYILKTGYSIGIAYMHKSTSRRVYNHDSANSAQTSHQLAIYDPRLISDGENVGFSAGIMRTDASQVRGV